LFQYKQIGNKYFYNPQRGFIIYQKNTFKLKNPCSSKQSNNCH